MTKVKKEKVLSLTETVRLYSSSLSARNAKYLYLNVTDDPYTFVMSNADYALLSAFIPHTLSLHLITLNPSEYEWFDQFKSILKITDNEPYLINLASLNRLLTKNKLEDLNFVRNDSDIRIANVEEESAIPDMEEEEVDIDSIDDDAPEKEKLVDKAGIELKEEPAVITFTDKAIYGCKIEEFQVLRTLKMLIDKVTKVTPEFLDTVPHKTINLSFDGYFHSNVFKLPVSKESFEELQKFIDEAGLALLLIDGSDTVSMKEFIKKAPSDTSVSLTVYLDGGNLKSLSCCSSSKFTIRSCRPHAGTVAVPRRVMSAS